MQMLKIKSDAQLSASKVPQGSVLKYMVQRDGQLVERAKKSDGSFVDVSAGTSGQSGTTASTDVTKFEVLITDTEIAAGTVDSVTGLTYAVAVPANMTHEFIIRSGTQQSKNNVIVDWGDGSSTELASLDSSYVDTSSYASSGQVQYTLQHTYSSAGRYTVTITGTDYWGLANSSSQSNQTSLVCRAFEDDLPIATFVTYLSSWLNFSQRLLRVHCNTGYKHPLSIYNSTNLFNSCKNLQEVSGMSQMFRSTAQVDNMFALCVNMRECDFRMPAQCLSSGAYRRCFRYCQNLQQDIADLLPLKGFLGKQVNFSQVFYGCAKLTGTIPAKFLWEDVTVQWTGTDCFTGCSDDIRAQAPVSWGGTADITVPTLLNDIETAQLVQTKISQSGNSSVQLAVVTGDVDETNKTVQVRPVTVDDNGDSTYSGQAVTVRYDFNIPEA